MELKKVGNIEFTEGGVCAAKGFRANGIQCGLAHAGASVTKKKNDLALIVSDTECTAAAVYTTNKVKGAPILVTKEHIKDGKARAVIVNSVNANTCNPDGYEKASKMCEIAADQLGLKAEDYQFYMDLRKYGSTRHSGYGLGFERCVMYLTGMGNIRDVIPFPRTVNNCDL